ncbi:hypothetical protein NK356_18945 [Chryseobacterium sp. S0630]|nr:hypothetical protein [Chryseobacterium sp. S0630]MCP1301260.1 hypothetical protein [Chryseobacterium sp. S0630]
MNELFVSSRKLKSIIMNYKVLSNFILENLEQEVNDYILRGWKPQGGIFVNASGFYQAISKV